MKGHLRLLNIACAAKAKWRQITLQKASRDSPLYFSLLGGSEKGFGIFVETVETGSKAAEVGLKRGDQVMFHKNIHESNVILTILCRPVTAYSRTYSFEIKRLKIVGICPLLSELCAS